MKNNYKIREKNGEKFFYRFTLNQRIQHIILASSVVILVLTGMPLKFYNVTWLHGLYALFGGIVYAPIVHRVAGVILMILFVFHCVYITVLFVTKGLIPLKKKEGLSFMNILKLLLNQPMVPNLKDLRDIRDLLKYYFFLTAKRPFGDRFTWKEKFDYWAPFWGMVIIGLSGLMMWNKEFVTRFISGEAINYALIAHSDEALLAALFLFIWHWYNVHFSLSVFPMGMAFLTGYLSEEIMIEEHYDHYVRVMERAGYSDQIKPPHGFDVNSTK